MPVYRAGLFRGCRPLLFPLGFAFPRESTSLWGFWPLRGTRSGQALSTPRELDEPFCRTFMRGFPQAGVMAPAASLPNGGCTVFSNPQCAPFASLIRAQESSSLDPAQDATRPGHG